MGHQNADRAMGAPVRPPAAKLVFVAMARQANDKHHTPRYWAGEEYLALVLSCSRRHIDTVLARLADDGWIKPDGYAGRRRVWVLNLPLSTGPGPDIHSG